jgi:hypothetical protein
LIFGREKERYFMKRSFLIVLGFLLAVCMVSSASAVLITPTTELQWTGNTVNPDSTEVATIVGYTGTLTEVYKADADPFEESGPFASSYETSFFNTTTDPSDADIVYTSGDVISGTAIYLLVWDGQIEEPYWYIFDLLNLDLNNDDSVDYSWNGTDTLELRGFWPDRGAISHVAIFSDSVPVPEPTTMLLLGFGLIGLATVGRKKMFK